MKIDGMTALDLFAGAGGWDIAARELGLKVDRVEIWQPAIATAALNGMSTAHRDVTTYVSEPGRHQVQIASPSCKKYSMAGGGEGRRALDRVLKGVELYRQRGAGLMHDRAVELIGDADAALTLEPLRIALEGEPDYIAWEQVPSVLPVWNACAAVLREHGYFTGCGILNAEQYGVPQTRRRAVLMARRSGPIVAPVITHSRFHVRDPKHLDAGVLPWVSMAEALGWGMTERPSMTVCGGGTDTGGAEPFGNGARQSVRRELEAGRWAMRNGNQANAATRDLDQPAGTLFFGARTNAVDWVFRRGPQANATERTLDQPAGTIMSQHSTNQTWVQRSNYSAPGQAGQTAAERGRTVRELVQPSIAVTGKSFQWAADGNPASSRGIRVDPREAAILQTFPLDYEFHGNKGEVLQQIGNAMPRVLARAVLLALFS